VKKARSGRRAGCAGAKNFINPERVAQSVVYTRSKKLGTARVVQELRNKGLDDDTVRAATAQLRATEHARAWACGSRSSASPPPHRRNA
jgi:regulatory protein